MITGLLILTLVVFAGIILHENHVSKLQRAHDCQDIIGDGYAMGTDPKPVVIGNTCDR